MFTKRLIPRLVVISLIVVSLLFSSLGTTPVYAAGITVNTAVDETTTNGLCSLREAIFNAHFGSTSPDCASGAGADIITFAGNYTITLNSSLNVGTEVVIKGNGATNTIIQANANPNAATYRVFKVFNLGVTFAGKLTLDSLTVRHGRCNGFCDSPNSAGGGILIEGADLTVINSNISANTAVESGGGIFSYSGAEGGFPSSLTVTNSSFSGNSAKYGGALFNVSTLTVTNGTFTGNEAVGLGAGGGGIYNVGTLTLTDSTLSDNQATSGSGGVIYNLGSATVTNSTLSDNHAAAGGAISNQGSLSIWSSTLNSNSAGTGGGIHNGSAGAMGIVNSTLSGNEADDNGGGIYNIGPDARIYNSTIVFNTLNEGTVDDAAGIHAAVTVSLYNSLVAINTIAPGIYTDCKGTLQSWGRNLFSGTAGCTINIASGSYSDYGPLSSLGPLQNNGGPTWTHALLPTSNAIDTGDDTVCTSWPIYNLDQRGMVRPQGSRCDVGAYEYVFPFAGITQWTTDYSYNAQQWRVQYHPRLLGDVDGDGDDDIVGFGFDRVLVALSDGTKFLPMSQWTTDFSYNAQGWRVEYHPRLLGDVNGDGKDDLVGFGFDRVLVALSTGSSFAPMTQWTTDFSYNAQGWRVEYHPRLLGDVNGDGKADIVGFGYDRVLVALSTGTSFAPMAQWTTDFSYNAQQWRTEYHPCLLGDVNGDGRADIVGFGYDRVLVALSTGTSFAPMTQWTTDFSYNAQQWRTEYHPRLLGDVNGDGRDDIVGFGYDRVLVAFSNGSGFAAMVQMTTDYSYNAQQWRVQFHPRLLGDVNDDGKADIVGFGYDRVLVATAP